MRGFASIFVVLTGCLLVGCGGGGGSSSSASTPVPGGGGTVVNGDPGGGPSHFTSLTTYQAKALAVADGLRSRAVQDSHGLTWQYADGSQVTRPSEVYEGSGGILIFLAEAYKAQPTSALHDALEAGGQWLLAQPSQASGAGLYTGGQAGLGWVCLSLYDALGDSAWLDAAKAKGTAVMGSTNPNASIAPADLIYGPGGDGLFLLRLYQETGDTTWLQGAKSIGDALLASGVTDASGTHWTETIGSSIRSYPGMAHGTAGGGYFLCHLAKALGATAGAPYKAEAIQAAQWLRSVKVSNQGQSAWCFYFPDEATTYPIQWCHGSPGVGIFFADLYTLTGDAADLQTAVDCASADAALSSGWVTSACLCHGTAGNGELFLKLYRMTGNAAWLQQAQAFGDAAWSATRGVTSPVWLSGDGTNRCNEGLMTGNAGVGHFLLELSDPTHLAMPFTD